MQKLLSGSPKETFSINLDNDLRKDLLNKKIYKSVILD
jgi:hypothetical protein